MPLLCLGFLFLPLTSLAAEADLSNLDYRIGPEDVLSVQVWDQKNLSIQVAVSQNGDFSYPLIGNVHAEGLTAAELERLLTEKLADGFLKNPQVSVTVKEYKSKKVFVLGEVRKPGPYALTGKASLIEMISRAGGLNPGAGRKIVVRKSSAAENEQKIFNVDLDRLLDGRDQDDVPLSNGDTIYIPKAAVFHVFGQVQKAGAYPLDDSTNVLQAITAAGGITDKGSTGRIKIIRNIEGNKVELKVELDDLVEEDDIIIVPERYF